MGFLKELFEKKLRSAGGQLTYDDLHGDDPMLSGGTYLAPQASARSFSYATHRKAQLDASERAAGVAHDAPQPRVRYDSIGQFSQRVELYRGSVATVFRSVCTSSGAKVIIKAYYKAKMHPRHHHKLQRELATMAALGGVYVAQLYASFEDSACIYIVMEHCEGGDLFKTMLMHGGLLDEAWVCVEVITPLLRILEKMHGLGILHRDIKPENIFLTSTGKFRLGDFGLAIDCRSELPFSRSGTLDYMAPEVLKNPSVPFQEGRSVDAAMLAARGVKPYGPPVDVWAAGVLAYELVCGRPPFEVEDEAQTAALIMHSDAIKFPPNRSAAWSDFVRDTLVKDPEARPSAAALLQHPWVTSNLQRVLSERHRPSKEMLLQPLPLDPSGDGTSTDGHGSRSVRRSVSLAATGGSGASRCREPGSGGGRDAAALAPLPSGGVPSGDVPALPAACPATPSGVPRLSAHAGGSIFGDHGSAPAAPRSSGVGSSTLAGGAAVRGSGSGSGSGSSLRASCLSPSNGAGSLRASSSSTCGALLVPGAAAATDRPHDTPGPAAGCSTLLAAAPGPASPWLSNTQGGGCCVGSSPLRPLHPPGAPHTLGASGSPLAPLAPPSVRLAAARGLRVALPTDAVEPSAGGSGDGSGGLCYSPSTPAVKPGMKERIKFYFQRQAGAEADGA